MAIPNKLCGIASHFFEYECKSVLIDKYTQIDEKRRLTLRRFEAMKSGEKPALVWLFDERQRQSRMKCLDDRGRSITRSVIDNDELCVLEPGLRNGPFQVLDGLSNPLLPVVDGDDDRE
jgi:hypothetical protein